MAAAPSTRRSFVESRLAPLAFVVLWSSAFIAVRAGLPDASPVLYLGLRFSLAAAILLLALWLWRRPGRWTALPFRHLVVSGILINGLYLSGAYIALETINAATMALIGAFHPLLTAILGLWVLNEKVREIQWLGLAVGFVGVVVVVGPGSAVWQEWHGLLFAAGGVFCLAAGTIYHKKFCRGLPIVPTIALQLTAAAVFCMLAAPAVERLELTLSPVLIMTLLYLAFVVSIGAMALFVLMLRRGTAGQVASNFYLTPGLTAVMGWLLLDEGLEMTEIVGFAVASLGVWLANRA